MAREIRVDLVGESAAFQSSMKAAGASVDRLETDLKEASAATSRFDGALGKTNAGLDNSTGKFRSTADLAGGLGNVLGIEALGQAEAFATGMADMADGLGGLLAPALAKSKVAFMAVNATMRANPILAVVSVLALLTAGFVIAYERSATFRAIVDGAMQGVKRAVQVAWAVIKGVFDVWLGYYKLLWSGAKMAANGIGSAFSAVEGVIMGVVNAIRGAWNSVLGGRSIGLPKVEIPFAPDFPGFSFTIPALAKGGIVNSPTLALIGEAGPEAVVPLSGRGAGRGVGGGGQVQITFVATGDPILDALARMIRVRGGNVQRVLGS